jgi:hypothetical protein
MPYIPLLPPLPATTAKISSSKGRCSKHLTVISTNLFKKDVMAPHPIHDLMLILSSILGLRTCQVDYTQAFPQAKLEDPVSFVFPKVGTLKMVIYNSIQTHVLTTRNIFYV